MNSIYLKIVNKQVFISKAFLTDNGLNIGTLNNYISKCNKGKTLFFTSIKDNRTGKTWIDYASIPIKYLNKYNLPKDSVELKNILTNSINDELTRTCPAINFAFQQTWLMERYWVEYIPLYKAYYFDIATVNLFARTHAIIQLLISLKEAKEYTLIEMHAAYMNLTHVVFKTSNYHYFSDKIINCQREGIAQTLVHDFKINGRSPYKITLLVEGIVKLYYSQKRKYSQTRIHELVNIELALRNLPKISLSTVSKICKNPELKNRADIIRYGKSYAENNILPYLNRDNVKNIGDLYEIDATRVNFPYQEGATVKFLNLCVIMDVFSRKIVGYSFGDVEEYHMITACIKNSFMKNEIIPRQILCDNHGAFRSVAFKNLEYKLHDYGIVIRRSRARNPKDKGHIESWFSKFQIQYLSNVLGFLGEGIKTKKIGGRIDYELEKTYSSKENRISKNTLISKISKNIQAYNDNDLIDVNKSPNEIFIKSKKTHTKKFNKHDVSYLFGRVKKIKVWRSMVVFRHHGRKHHYTIWNTLIANRINGTRVNVYLDEFDLSTIHIFDEKEKYICDLKRNKSVSPVAYTEKEKGIYQNHFFRVKQRIQQNLKEIYLEIEESTEMLKATPIVSLDHTMEKEIDLIKQEDKNLMERSLKNYNVTTASEFSENHFKTFIHKPKTKFKIKEIKQ